ncbi:MAG: ribosome maturation factor RimM [Desulfovibrionaceae bacterium]
MADKDYIAIGKVAKPHGLKGEVCVDYHADSPLFLEAGSAVFLARPGARPSPASVRAVRMHKGRPLVTFAHVADRTGAETLRGLVVYVTPQDIPEPDPDEIFLYQLIGCQVFLEHGEAVGVIRDILTPTVEQEIWIIDAPDGAEILFPAAEETVREADLDARRIIIDPPPGLLELYRRDAAAPPSNEPDTGAAP